jgi:hypothetical protein
MDEEPDALDEPAAEPDAEVPVDPEAAADPEQAAEPEDPGVTLPPDAQRASDIFTRENVDDLLERGVGTFQAMEVIRLMVPRVPPSCLARDLLFLIEAVGTEGGFVEWTYINSFVDAMNILAREFIPSDEDQPEEEFPLTEDFIGDRLSDVQPVEGREFTFLSLHFWSKNQR